MKLLVLLLSLGLSTTAFASKTPYGPELDKRLTNLEQTGVGGTLLSAKMIVGSSGNVATARTLSGAASVGNTGVVALTDTLTDGNYGLKVAKASFAFADGDLAVTTVHGLGVSLPAKALIVRSWIHITTQFSDTGTCSFAIQCEDANNIKTSTDISGTAADGLIEGESTGAATAFKKSIASTCEISSLMTDTSSCVPLTGAGEVFVEYVVLN